MLCAGYLHQFWGVWRFSSTGFTTTTNRGLSGMICFANATLFFLMMVLIVVFCVLGSTSKIISGLIVSTWVRVLMVDLPDLEPAANGTARSASLYLPYAHSDL